MKIVRQVKLARQVRWSAVDTDGDFKWGFGHVARGNHGRDL